MMLTFSDKYHLEVHFSMTLCVLRPLSFSVGTWFSLPPRRDIGVSPRCRGEVSKLLSSACSLLMSVTSGWTWNGSSLTL